MKLTSQSPELKEHINSVSHWEEQWKDIDVLIQNVVSKWHIKSSTLS